LLLVIEVGLAASQTGSDVHVAALIRIAIRLKEISGVYHLRAFRPVFS
jgi:hypothetical protein